MYVPREIGPAVQDALRMFPAVVLTGPRQSGKTTFVRETLGDRFAYVSMDDPLERDFARTDPNGFLDRFGERPLILDEVQYVPGLLPYLKLRIDADRDRTGRYLLTGSQQFRVMRDVGESLAGRLAVLDLLPFSLAERGSKADLAETLWSGLYPEPSLHPMKRDLWLRGYVETYVERDVRQLTSVRDLASFQTFLQAAAAAHGQEFNMAAVSRRCGITQPTVKAWAGVLQASYLAHLLPPFHKNFGKRLVKTSKLFLLDPALVTYLTRQPGPEAALSGAQGGALFEGLVVSETLKAFAALGRRPDVYHWRSREGLEVDLIVQVAGRLLPIEVKLTATPSVRHTGPLESFKRLAGKEAADRGVLVCRAQEPTPLPHGNLALPWREFPAFLREVLAG